VHREYAIVLEKNVPTVVQDAWNYTLSVQVPRFS
jgi:hypothetical protein